MIKMVMMDVDGVMTDGSIFVGESVDELKGFNVKDGMGIVLAQKAGVKIVFLSGRYSRALANRAKELGVEDVYHNATDKVAVVSELMKKYLLKKQEIAYIGDDINDIPVLRSVGFPCVVNDAIDEVKSIAKYVSRLNGGRGAVREILDMILKAEDLFDRALRDYLDERKSGS